MRVLTAPAMLMITLVCAAPASADPGGSGLPVPPPPPFVDHAEWILWGQLPSLHVYPTAAGRAAARQPGPVGADADEAWGEVLVLKPDAGTPGMREQFVCHWELAEFAQPGKTSWNLEPWRPVVNADEMIGSGCNPDGSQVEPQPTNGAQF
jgi:hypothetical protein